MFVSPLFSFLSYQTDSRSLIKILLHFHLLIIIIFLLQITNRDLVCRVSSKGSELQRALLRKEENVSVNAKCQSGRLRYERATVL